MRIAIIGAGLSGISCALEFEKNGITPTIFDKKSFPHYSLELNLCLLNNMKMPFSDPLDYLKNQFNINLKPTFPINKIILNSQNETASLDGNHGYMFRIGRDSYSIDHQLSKKIKSHIVFNKYIEKVSDIENDFDHIIVATGSLNIAKNLGLCFPLISDKIKVGIVVGEFEPGVLTVWFDKRFAKESYVHMFAHSRKEALIILRVNDVSYNELEFYWKKFLSTIEINYKLIETSDLNFDIGIIKSLKIGNAYFIGNSAGLSQEFLGFGVINSIESGILAAQSIIRGENYEELCKHLINRINKVSSTRIHLYNLDNQDFDVVVRSINKNQSDLQQMPIVNQIESSLSRLYKLNI